VVTNFFWERTPSVFRLKVSIGGMWMGYIGMVEGTSQEESQSWPGMGYRR
jgi:hypothetical protein